LKIWERTLVSFKRFFVIEIQLISPQNNRQFRLAPNRLENRVPDEIIILASQSDDLLQARMNRVLIALFVECGETFGTACPKVECLFNHKP